MSALEVLQSRLLASAAGIHHAFFTRQGGVSTGVYESLNLGRGSNDDPGDVRENRRRAAALFEAPPEALLSCYQIHSAHVLAADGPWGEARPQGDGVVTARPGLVCGALAADCAPVLIADAEGRVVGAVHAGWQGALAGVVGSAVEAMVALGADPARMTAAIGPCIGPQSYEVGVEFLQRFEREAPGSGQFFAPGETADKRLFDLPGFVLDRLADAGLGQAEWIGRDTFAEPALFYSNRRSFRRGEQDYGRLLSAIMLT